MADGRAVVLVTGAAGAIGSALLRRFADAGARTVGTDLVDVAADPVSADLWVPGDVTAAADLDRVVAAAVERFGRLDVVVINAGVTALGSFESTSDEAFRRVVDVNLHGAVHTLRAALPALRSSAGRVVVLSSVAGFAPVVGRPAYVASKHALTGLFESLRSELARDGVTVTLVFPTFLDTAPADVGGGGTGAGRSITGGLLTSDDVARAVVRGVAEGRERVYPGRVSKAARLLHRFAPGVYARAMRRRLGAEPH